MSDKLKVLMVDAANGFYKTKKYNIGDFFGPVDLGLHLAGHYRSLNIGTGLLSGSIFPGSNRLVFSGFSPAWGGFFVSSMGGAGLVFNNLGINMLSLINKSSYPGVLILNRKHGEEIDVRIEPVDVENLWAQNGIYALHDYLKNKYTSLYENDPRILVTGPASKVSDFGAIASIPIIKGEITHVDTWAGRGGFGTRLFQEHGLCAIVYGGTHLDDDFRDRKVADEWFIAKYQQKMAIKDLEATAKYRFEPKFQTGGTFGVNFATLAGQMLSFNYRSINFTEEERLYIHENFVKNHYLKQFNEETIIPKLQKTCGEPCGAVCKKMRDVYKKDYEPYQVMGPLSGVFDQRGAELLNRQADTAGFDGISLGGVISWLLDCVYEGLLSKEDVFIDAIPNFDFRNFDVVEDSLKNARLGTQIIQAILAQKIDLSQGARKYGRHLARSHGQKVLNRFLYNAFARKGWMVPNQYWTSGAMSPMAIMGKYYMHYGKDFLPPRALGRQNAERFKKELIMDNLGVCRFHRLWAEEMLPEIIESLYGLSKEFLRNIELTAGRINSRNASVFWESALCRNFVHSFLLRKKNVEKIEDPELDLWLEKFQSDEKEAAFAFWYEIHKGIQETLTEFD